ncbi:adenylate/guanylate cyclase domain-containing protein [Ruegeria aquimaris]|uniref:Adenylate/guanylate cyclase domain-containing protein n=1 Tax=Ruegeria aquimaris TaxID=2984333 RepID=A0ABT3AG57_9RHOB|nr:adenylate/guanylate cyclase domain-containing protein [Ruegeria sp. XHP0148]MCV2887664.1 adenylate/guanylate cyclase domain-containing protein [Ruegeria sp. XHP0148]
MADITAPARRRERFFFTQPDEFDLDNRFTEAALERHKREGLELAVRARWVAMLVIAVLLIFVNPQWEVLYYHGILGLIALNGWFIRRAGRVGQSRTELFLIFVDLLIMTLGMVLPNPFSQDIRPLAGQYWFDNFQYFFVILAAGTLAYSWRTVIAIGTWTTVMWTTGWLLAWWLSTPIPELSERAAAAFANFPDVAEHMDPNSFMPELRVQEVVVFLIVAVTLGISARRFNRLLMNNAGLERERANLSRYFSPNVVDALSQNDEPLKQVRQEDIAVLFIDIVGFTRFAAGRDPYEVIEVLRGFHARMETQVFRHHGTLDKYLGDGLMATFGTPVAGERDATNALACAREMVVEIEKWNRDRRRAGEPEIHAGIGLHFGPAVLGDIGANRLEFAVIGNTVNVAAKLEAQTRLCGAGIVISDELRDRILQENQGGDKLLDGFGKHENECLPGIGDPMTVWTL